MVELPILIGTENPIGQFFSNKTLRLDMALLKMRVPRCKRKKLHSGKLTELAGKCTRIEDVYPIEIGDIPLPC